LQGANSSVTGIANLFGPGQFTLLFAFAISPARSWRLPGAPFLIATLPLSLSGIIAWQVTRLRRAG